MKRGNAGIASVDSRACEKDFEGPEISTIFGAVEDRMGAKALMNANATAVARPAQTVSVLTYVIGTSLQLKGPRSLAGVGSRADHYE